VTQSEPLAHHYASHSGRRAPVRLALTILRRGTQYGPLPGDPVTDEHKGGVDERSRKARWPDRRTTSPPEA
jgi:hypothetical protein